ncbi:ABC transporter ATP-binding protein [Metabacillus sp. RGM 3146]|uniref:ABC transporter ATP-binding protein n=1 Tax=Metabacillus sp. RGM 3146 TaxID=3401092 RepID=UPI003B9B7CD0
MDVLTAHELYRFYHASEEEIMALRGISLSIKKGEFLAIMGPSGSGKSTLLSCLVGIDEPDGGYVELDGRRITRRMEAERAAIRSSEIGILLQTGNLFQHLTVEGNIRLQMNLAAKNGKQTIAHLLDLVGLNHRRKSYPKQLSGGEAARAGLAVALSNSPKLLIADEPTGEVDAETEKHIIQIFNKRREAGESTLVATHSEALAKHADRIIRLFDGRIINET